MGLDIVELIMRAEEEFEIEIPDSDAERLSTPGALCDYIERKLALLRPRSSSGCPTSLAFYAVRRELMQLGIERQCVTPSAQVADLWPASKRRENWHALGKALGFPLPILRRSPAWAFVGFLPLSAFPVWLWVSPNTAFAFLAFYLLLWHFISQATAPFFAVHPPYLYSVADISRSLARRFTISAPTPLPDIWEKVRSIVAEESGEPLEKVTRDADFCRDLGMG